MDVDAYVYWTALIILICIILHPLLLLVSIKFDLPLLLSGDSFYIWFGIVGWFLLITYDIGKALKKYNFFVRNWNNILIISNIGFLLTFFHSLNVGEHLQSQPLRGIWIFLGVTAIAAIVWTYGIKKLLPRNQ